MKIACVVPVYNEEKNLAKLLPKLNSLVKKEDIIIIDDGSQDGSFGIARGHGFKTIRNPENLGKGASSQAVQNMNIMCGFEETVGLS